MSCLYVKQLLERYFTRQATAAETEALLPFLADPANEAAIIAVMEEIWTAYQPAESPFSKEEADGMLLHILDRPREAPLRRFSLLKWVAAAAIIIVTAATWLLVSRTGFRQPPTAISDIQPGRAGAILRLANGREVTLDSLGNGQIAHQNGVVISLHNNRVIYHGAAQQEPPAWNVLSTPRGRQFQLQLPDGSRVWLNAASSVKFPTVFTGTERRVEVTGEVYIEVVANKAMPFHVNTRQANIEVLGTSFNIKSYDDEPAEKTTLLEGKIRVSQPQRPDKPVVLSPGEQAVMQKSDLQVVSNANIDQVMAWRNGLLNFEGASLQEVMLQISRWYNVEVVYEDGMPVKYFEGQMRQDMSLSEVLKLLSQTGVQFRLEAGRRLVILKQ